MEQQLLSLTEAADQIRVPVSTLRYWRGRGEGPASARVGRRVVYRKADVEAWIAAQFVSDGRRGGDAA